jgi:alpha-L-rhamnosidase
MNSFNHYAYGAVLSWMYGTMAGIREGSSGKGFKEFVLAPLPDRRVGKVDASFDSPYGIIRSAWSYGKDGSWTWNFTIPPNTTAIVVVPGCKSETLGPGTYMRKVVSLMKNPV